MSPSPGRLFGSRVRVVATKVFGEMDTGLNQHGSSHSHTLNSAQDSLERLQLDVVRRGLVHYVGVSNSAAWQIRESAVCGWDTRH